MSIEQLKHRMQLFAVEVIRFAGTMPRYGTYQVISNQLVRAATSVGANYRATCRAKSRADFLSKMKVVEEECDESIYWLELLEKMGRVDPPAIAALLKEGNEILSIVVASIKTARSAH